MYRGRGGRGGGGGRPFSMRGVRPAQMKPGRGRAGGFPRGGLRPLFEPGWGPLAPRMRGMGPRPPSFAGPMRGRGGPRGRGGAPGAAGRGWASTRGRGAGGRGAASTTTPKKKKKSSGKTSKSEKERDEVALTRPWITEEIRAEVLKKGELQDLSEKTKDEKDVAAFQAQKSKVSEMLKAARIEYIGMQEEQDVAKIMADARQKSKDAAESKKKSENGDGTSEATPAANGEAAEAPAGDAAAV